MKTVIVTGVSKGLGRFIADSFNGNGWRVVGTGRSSRPDDLSENVEYFQFDASDSKESTKFWDQIKLDKGPVCLINNAGGYIGGGLLDTKIEDYENQMKINFFTGVNMTRGLISKVPSARIINVISNIALVVNTKESAYSASKAAAMHFFKALQHEYPPEKYKITNLYPSNIDSNGTNPKIINPEEMADFIVDLAESNKSYYPKDITLFHVGS